MAYLIVGGGLAGISLAENFLEKKEQVVLVDAHDQPSSTKVATGVANPIVFKRLNKSWRVDELAPFALDFYSKMDEKLGIQSLSSVTIDKWIKSDDYRTFWNTRAQEPEYKPYLNPVDGDLGRVLQAFAVDCPVLMEAYREHLQSTGSFRNDSFDLDHLKSIDQQLEYNGEVYDSVVFCEGAYAVYNPLWNWLPFKVAKGDWIVIETEYELCDTILNNVVNTIPLGNRRYKLSSTFEWETMSWEPSKNAVKELTKAFEERFNVPYKIVEHASGLRPAASDRRPYLGVHPRIPKHFIFNGFGSKGVLLAPFFADQLTKHILEGAPLNQEVDIKRHLRRFQAQHP